ncbi:MAG: hypothetical protein ACLU3I_15860 [Acutalibacteraceae bacterium]
MTVRAAMAAAYAAFADEGVWREARTYTIVTDSNGQERHSGQHAEFARRHEGHDRVVYHRYARERPSNTGTGYGGAAGKHDRRRQDRHDHERL